MLAITNTVRGLFARPATPSRPRPRRRPLRLEWLEERTLLCNPGELDLTFDGDGKVTTGGAAQDAYDVALQTDGKIVVAGYGISGNSQGDNFAVARYTASGSLDSTFGGTGLVFTDVTNNKADRANAVAIQSDDGKIIAAGYTTKQTSNQEWALVRYNSNGTLDSSFGSKGKVITNMGSSSESITSIVIQPDGKIIAGGYTQMPDNDFTLVRYNANGTLDASFGAGGKVTTDFGSSERVRRLVLQTDGRIVAVGHTMDPAVNGTSNFAIARYNANGSLDSTFGTGGKVITTGVGEARDVAIQADGSIVVAGLQDGEGQFALARYTTSGVLDATFGGDGVVDTFIPGADQAMAVSVQSDGKIVVAGSGDFTLARYNSDGSLDISFGTGGVVNTSFGTGTVAHATSMELQPDGRIIAVGFTALAGAGNPHDFALARYCP